MEKYGVEDAAAQQRVELANVQRRRIEIERSGLEKAAGAGGELAELQRREQELLRALANQ